MRKGYREAENQRKQNTNKKNSHISVQNSILKMGILNRHFTKKSKRQNFKNID